MSGSEFLLYLPETGRPEIIVRLEDETVWLTQSQMADLFQTTKQNISLHIRNIFDEGELSPDSVVKENLTTAADGKSYRVLYYNLDVIISVGYRVKSHIGTRFRIWATQQLRTYLAKGFLLNDRRFKEDPGDRHFEELLQRIRDIRSSEKVFWRKVLDIYSTSEDYDPDEETSKLFFASVQNKMHWAAHGQTAAEVVLRRVDAKKANAGMTNFPGDRPLPSDAKIAKNYLSEEELKALNLIVSLYLDFAELQALNRRSMTMAAWIAKLDDFLRISERDILRHAGRVSRTDADRKATDEFEKWRAEQRKIKSAAEADFERALEATEKLIKAKRKARKQSNG